MSGKDVTFSESWDGIGEYWSGYSALLTDMVGGLMLVKEATRGSGFSREIDYQLYSLLDETARDALCFYYGLQGRTKKSLDETVRCLNNLSFNGTHYDVKSVNDIIVGSIIKLSECPELQEYISELTGGKCFGTAQ